MMCCGMWYIYKINDFFQIIKGKIKLVFLLFVSSLFFQDVYGQKELEIHDFVVEHQEFVVGDQEMEFEIIALTKIGEMDKSINGEYIFELQGEKNLVKFHNGIGIEHFFVQNDDPIVVKDSDSGKTKTIEIRHIEAWMSLIPPLLAIIMALIFKEVISSLFLGIFSAIFILNGFSFKSLFISFLQVFDTYIVNSLADEDHIYVILFSLFIGGMVAIVSHNGGMAGIVNHLSKYAKSRRSANFITWLLGVTIFFDDYANTLIVGNTMRAVTDKYKISREKLAFIVDSTAAPVASIAFITTWIGAELGYISESIKTTGISESAYSMFLNSLQYAYYPIFMLVFILILIYYKKDFGPMLKAEKRARDTGVLDVKSTKKVEVDDVFHEEERQDVFEPLNPDKHRWYNAFFPIALVLIVTFMGLIYTGTETSLQQLHDKGIVLKSHSFSNVWTNLHKLSSAEDLSFFRKLGVIIGNSNAYKALIWGSILGILLAIIQTTAQRILRLGQVIESMIVGFKAMMPAIITLILAWTLSQLAQDMNTAGFITNSLLGTISPWVIPGITFVLAAGVAFATGSSWGTMAIVYPLILPTTWAVCQTTGLSISDSMQIMYHVISVVLAGSVLGDHCSPISDTTILSSLASNCNHIEHVKTQLPYAMTVGAVSLFASLVLVNIGFPWFLNFPIGFLLLYMIVKTFGKKV